MIKVTGKFIKHNGVVVLMFLLDKEYFNRLKNHVANHMFIAFRRIAPLFKGILLTSIGDHLDKNNNQNLEEADIAVHIDLIETPPKDYIYLLDKAKEWNVCAACEEESLGITIEKDSQYISVRHYVDVG